MHITLSLPSLGLPFCVLVSRSLLYFLSHRCSLCILRPQHHLLTQFHLDGHLDCFQFFFVYLCNLKQCYSAHLFTYFCHIVASIAQRRAPGCVIVPESKSLHSLSVVSFVPKAGQTCRATNRPEVTLTLPLTLANIGLTEPEN
jgi:hypothetical protein